MFSKKKITIYVILIVLGLGFCSYLFIKPSKKLPVPEDTLSEIIKKNIEPISIKPCFGGKAFCDYKIISFDQKNNTIKIYLWIIAQEYYIKDNKLSKGVGGQFPAVITIERRENKCILKNYKISRAEETNESLKIFPEKIISKAYRSSNIDNDSIKKIDENAKIYFKIKKATK